VRIEWLFQAWPLYAADAGPWMLGWEFVLALVTLGLAGVTGWLAWTTRRLARATAEEVQGQTRPVLVPTRRKPTPVQETPVSWTDPQGIKATRTLEVTIEFENIGVGPCSRRRHGVHRTGPLAWQ
jgi:hypothetical protein